MSDSMDASTLYPGHRWVEEFGDDDEYERDENGEIIEDVEYVTIDLGVVEPTLVPSSSAYRLIGLDTPHPYLQLSGTIFKGKHQTLLGTELLFTDAQDDAHDRAKRPLVHVANTEKRIVFKEVELREKGSGGAKQPEASAHGAGKKRKPRTVDEVVGNDDTVEEQAVRGRRGRRPRGGRKSKGKERAENDDGELSVNETGAGAETPRAQDDPMDTSER